MAKKQRVSEGESTYLAPETLPPPVALAEFLGHPERYCVEGPKMGRPLKEPIVQRGYDGPPIAPSYASISEFAAPKEPVPIVSGLGISAALAPKGWVAYRCHTTGQVDILTPARADGTLEGESKPSAAARMMKAIAEEYR